MTFTMQILDQSPREARDIQQVLVHPANLTVASGFHRISALRLAPDRRKRNAAPLLQLSAFLPLRLRVFVYPLVPHTAAASPPPPRTVAVGSCHVWMTPLSASGGAVVRNGRWRRLGTERRGYFDRWHMHVNLELAALFFSVCSTTNRLTCTSGCWSVELTCCQEFLPFGMTMMIRSSSSFTIKY